MLGPILLSIHNLTYYQRLMKRAREAISADRFSAFGKNENGPGHVRHDEAIESLPVEPGQSDVCRPSPGRPCPLRRFTL